MFQKLSPEETLSIDENFNSTRKSEIASTLAEDDANEATLIEQIEVELAEITTSHLMADGVVHMGEGIIKKE